MPSTTRQQLFRLSAAALLAAGLGGGGALAASADSAPVPPQPVLSALSGTGDTAGELSKAVEQAIGMDPTAPLLGWPTAPSASGEASSATSSTESSTTGPAPGIAGSPAGRSATEASPAAAPEPPPSEPSAAEAPASVAVGTPVVSACVIPTGSASPAFEIDLSAAGVDLSSPLVEQIPQAFTACPKDAVAAGPNLVSADAGIQGLLGACVRVTTQVAPLQTTLVVLDRTVVEELTAAGLPLDQLAVPCPGSAAGGNPPAADNGAGSSDGGSDGGSPRSAASAIPGLPDRLAFTGSSTGPALVTAVGLLCLGSLLMRKAALLARRR